MLRACPFISLAVLMMYRKNDGRGYLPAASLNEGSPRLFLRRRHLAPLLHIEPDNKGSRHYRSRKVSSFAGRYMGKRNRKKGSVWNLPE